MKRENRRKEKKRKENKNKIVFKILIIYIVFDFFCNFR